MTHDHIIVDTDKVFTIDPISRKVTNETGAKSDLMQFDHNSERLTFKMPKLVEGHDMLNSDKVQVHFTNVGTGTSVSSRAVNSGIYVVRDMQVNPEDPNTITFSWLIGEESTQLAGTLTFLVKFICDGEDGEPGTGYKWHTYPCTYITIQPGMNNTDDVVIINSDVILELERRMDEIASEWDQNHITSIDINDAGELVFTFVDGSTTNAGRAIGPQGPQGPRGNSGVYVGSGDMPDDCNVQIDPDGEVIDIDAIRKETTPVKGVDYFDGNDYILTDDDKDDIAARVFVLIKDRGVVGYVDENNNIVLSGKVADGTYTVKYEMEDGSTIDIGELVLSDEKDTITYTNLANPNDSYWKDNCRLSIGSGSAQTCEGRTVTNFIPAKAGDILRVKGMSITTALNSQESKIVMYSTKDAESSNVGGLYGTTPAEDANGYGAKVAVDGDVSIITLLYSNTGVQSATANMNYIRLDGVLIDGYTKDEVIITINEEIV